MDYIEQLPEEIIPAPTTQELINESQSEMLSIKARLSADDYKHSRQLRELAINVPLTLSQEEYRQLCADQVALTARYNELEAEVERLQLILAEEQNKIGEGNERTETFHFVDPPYINSDCGHYEGAFNELHMERLLQLLERIQGKFMLTMFPLDMIEAYAVKNGWIIHRIERTISASKTNRRKQEEWIVCNYSNNKDLQLEMF